MRDNDVNDQDTMTLRDRPGSRHDAMSRACNVIANGFEQGAHVGAAERAKAGAA